MGEDFNGGEPVPPLYPGETLQANVTPLQNVSPDRLQVRCLRDLNVLARRD